MADASESERTVLIPIDGSPHCERAIQWYLKHMKKGTDCLKFINVIEPIYTTPAFGMAMETPPMPDIARVMQESIVCGKNLCRDYMHQAKENHVKSQAYIHVDSKPGSAIIKSICDHGADVVIMGNRGMGVMRRTFLGSVSDYVLHHAHVPVIIVPPEEQKRASS